MLLGIWKNIEELESSISLTELEAILKAAQERDHRNKKFTAALKGIDLDAGEDSIKERFEAAKRRAEAKTSGKSVDEIEFDVLGLDVEIEE